VTYTPKAKYGFHVAEVPPFDWVHAPDPLIHSWRWRQPEAKFYTMVYDEMQGLVRDFKADLRRVLA
jgi:hypothetical protein